MSSDSFFIFLDKPEGITSQQCLSRFKRKFNIDKIGHHGTLDPFATGMLLAGIHQATKFFRFIDDTKKTYEAILKFGVATDTLDHTGTILSEKDVPEWTEQDIDRALQSLTGLILQKPPMYSAIKRDGERLYKLARQGIEVEREEREVFVHELKILEWKRPLLKLRTSVSRGTYVRVLAEQIAAYLGNIAHLTGLKRTELCGVDVASSFDAESSSDIPSDKKITVSSLLQNWPELILNETQRDDLFCGRLVQLNGEQIPDKPSDYFRATFQGLFLGMVTLQGANVTAERLMSSGK